jgi:predicted MPP superfamily phosphohydrolase
MDPASFESLRKRLGEGHFGKRIREQTHQVAIKLSGARGHLYWENLSLLPKTLKLILQATGLYNWANRNTIRFAVEEVEVAFRNLPKVFDGYRILHLSDLHIDGLPDGGDELIRRVSALDFDLCVLTGDYRFSTRGRYEHVVEKMARLVPALECTDGILGILGNHDYIEMVPGLEKLGIRMLLNEVQPIERGGERFWVVGVDDPHFYEVDDLDRAIYKVDGPETTILLTHSPEMYKTAADMKVDYMLCGHTHAGQMCLPGGIAIITNARCPRRLTSGSWEYKGMRGHTSRGTGSSGLPVRMFCPPEITLHTLRSAQL